MLVNGTPVDAGLYTGFMVVCKRCKYRYMECEFEFCWFSGIYRITHDLKCRCCTVEKNRNKKTTACECYLCSIYALSIKLNMFQTRDKAKALWETCYLRFIIWWGLCAVTLKTQCFSLVQLNSLFAGVINNPFEGMCVYIKCIYLKKNTERGLAGPFTMTGLYVTKYFL